MLYFKCDGMKKKNIIKISIILLLLVLLIPLGINLYVIMQTSKNIYEVNEIKDTYDMAMVLGCGVKNNKPSLMLKDRLLKVIELYKENKIKYILLTGDETDKEVSIMKEYLIDNDIPEDIILTDEVGYSTSISMKNYQDKYLDKKVIIITQQYHLYRALYIASRMDIQAIGVASQKVHYYGAMYREVREILARVKDFFKTL